MLLQKFSIFDILECEENITSIVWGIRGKVDVTVLARVINEDGSSIISPFPLEMKTGRGFEEEQADSIYNPVELSLVAELARAFVDAGVAPNDIGVLSVYKQQVVLLESLLATIGIETWTIDRSQGREKACVLVSMVRSNSLNRVGELIDDRKRMNYLPSSSAPEAYTWKRKDSGHMLAVRGPDGLTRMAVITLVGVVSDGSLFVDKIGGWNGSKQSGPIEKAKFSFVLEPSDGVFGKDWPTALANGKKMQTSIASTSFLRYWITDDGNFRFIKPVFEKRNNPNEVGYDTDKWPVPEDLEMPFYQAGQSHLFSPLVRCGHVYPL
ncbi:hypothetical protein HMN09_01167700 [Mycena chlorophos]|uniref:DNA2/NAM7 helicase-like C-terminal domain-containing protein n=1 Tax=Mycena chlorophos TaxID=658473 RepID=A0A8H6S9D9_MYCCL|nr:hypothetical protein HMN09_01167700 [Mycena chlorophos]